MLEPHLSWRAHAGATFGDVAGSLSRRPRYVFGVGTSAFVAGAALVILECHFSWQAHYCWSVTRFGDFAM